MNDARDESHVLAVIEDLAMYQENCLPIELHLASHPHQDYFEGIIVTIGQDFVLMARLSQMSWLNGFRAVRLTMIREVLPLLPLDERFVCRALQARGETIPPEPPIHAHTLAEIAESICQVFPIVLFGLQNPDAKYRDLAGNVQQVDEGLVKLRCLSTEGFWLPVHEKFQVDDIWEISFESEYERTLALISQLPDADGPSPS